MAYVRGVLSGVTAIFLTLCMPGLINAFKGISQEKATGLAAVAGGLTEAVLSPLFWLITIGLFALFFAAGRLNSKALRIILFWIPTLFLSTLAAGMSALAAYVYFHFR